MTSYHGRLDRSTGRFDAAAGGGPGEGSDYNGPPSNIQTAFVSQGSPNGGAMTRVGTFVGAVSGNTIVGRYARSMAYSVNLVTQLHKNGYPSTGVNIILTKQ